MIVSPDALRKDTVTLIQQIDMQIAEVTRHAEQISVEPHRLRDAGGNWVMIPLLLAKAQAYNTLVQLQPKK